MSDEQQAANQAAVDQQAAESAGASADSLAGSDVDAARKLFEQFSTLREQMAKVIVGQEDVIEQLMTAMLGNGHCMLEGVPGLAKTLTIHTLARCMDLSFSRIQFTPDLMPSDITGTEVIQEDRTTGTRAFKFLRGPIFANVVLADEINRTPPKTQAALLEAMQERHVTVGSEEHDLAPPFFVLATQNPIEQEGTYPLPEAQQDRFMFKVLVSYQSYDEEYAIAERTTVDQDPQISQVMTSDDILASQRLVRRVPVAPDVLRYAIGLTRATRVQDPSSPEFVKQMVVWGGGPRMIQALVLGAKARAVLLGRHHAAVEDIQALARPVMRHRLVTSFSAEAEGYTPDRIVDELIAAIDPHATGVTNDDQYRKVLSA